MRSQYRCQNERRRQKVIDTRDPDGDLISGGIDINGIDYLEVEPGKTELRLYFLNNLKGDLPDDKVLPKENISIYSGSGNRKVDILDSLCTGSRVITIHLDKPGDSCGRL